ncbi:MAG TPA: hypothetical protein VMW07_01330 [Gallionella sp.]|nr:hypothetical protein [Gallionella sp.]
MRKRALRASVNACLQVTPVPHSKQLGEERAPRNAAIESRSRRVEIF